MSLLSCAEAAKEAESVARLRRAVAIRALIALGNTQQSVADSMGISQPAVSQLLKSSHRIEELNSQDAMNVASPIVKEVAHALGFRDIAVFGSIARGTAHKESDVDFLVQPPRGAQIRDLVEFRDLLGEVLGREVDVITYGALKPELDSDIRREAVLL